MYPTSLSRVGRLVLLVAIAAGLTGCSSSEVVTTTDDAHIKQVAVLYGQFIGMNKGKPPADEKAFKTFVQQNLTARQSTDTVETVLTSPRDKQPYVLRYGVLAGTDKPAVVVYEQTGKNGKRFVGLSHGGTEEVDDKKFKELVPNG